MDKSIIEEWLKDNGDGYGYGSGSGSGYGSGSGDGSGYGSGSGYGYGDGSGDGSGYGSGDGYGYGYGDGYGYGYGYGYGIKKYNDHYVFSIDRVQTIITKIKGNIAKGYYLRSDFTLVSTFVAKGQGYFAHGQTVREAVESLEEKIFENLDFEEKIKVFKSTFDSNTKYKGTLFFEWHHKLTGSCLQGRNEFVKEHNLDLNKEYTVKEFLEIIKNSYGWSKIKELEDYYKE